MFTFHVRNAGNQMISWDLGCQRSLPIVLHLPEGRLPIGPGAVDACEFTCDEIYAGTTPGACSDCGPGYSGRAAPGESADIVWDRRVYTEHRFDPGCRPPSPPLAATCALGHAVAPSAAQTGTIVICLGTVPYPGACQTPGGMMMIDSRPVEFTVDTTGTDAVIEVP